MTLDEAIRHCEEVADNCAVTECEMEHRQLAEWLKELKQRRAEQRWILCSEKLPEEKTRVLTTIKMPSREPQVRSGIYSDGFFMNDNGDVWRTTDKEIKAWKPLPEAYREEK